LGADFIARLLKAFVGVYQRDGIEKSLRGVAALASIPGAVGRGYVDTPADLMVRAHF
jgi:hypothetical protein